jgi:hypothetical protein
MTSPATEPADDRSLGTGTLGRYFSYFSHRVFVTYRPADLREYLERLFHVDEKPGTAGEEDAEILRWVLLHRARLNPLSLNREIEALRGGYDELLVPARMVDILQNRIDFTLQYAVELALGRKELNAWIERRPRMRQPLLDAAYYVSACFERDQTQEVVGGAETNLLDLTPAGRDAFGDYLLQRMNLYANESPPDDEEERLAWEEERRAIGIRALPEQDLRRLYVVACEVARTVAYATSSTALEQEWLQRSPGDQTVVSLRSKQLYPALLLGPGADTRVLVPQFTGDPDCMRFRWTFRPSGEELPDRKRNEIVDEGGLLTARWEAIGQVLNLAAWQGKTITDDSQDLRRRMMDQHRLLRLTPDGWIALSASAAALSRPDSEIKLQRLLEHVNRLREFVDRAARYAVIESTCLALLCAAAIEGLSGEERLSDGLEAGLDAVARGLRLDLCQPEQGQARLVELRERIAKLCGEPLPLPPVVLPPPVVPSPAAWPAWPDATEFQERVAAAFALGQANALAIDDEVYWRAVASRVQTSRDLASAALPLAATLYEICGWLARDPEDRLVDLDLSRMTLRRWSAVLRRIVVDASADDGSPPAWIVVHVLERLGARGLNVDAQEALLNKLEGGLSFDKPIREERGETLWQGTGGQSRVALVIASAATSVTDAWALPPTDGLIVVATAPEAASMILSKLGQALFKSFGTLQLAIEHPLPAEKQLDELRLQMQVASIGQGPVCWIYREGQAGGKVPRMVGPGSPAELWAAVARGS